jgi:F-box and WD-40 domain protein CDC4
MCVLFSNETTVVSGSKDATIRVWDIASGDCRHVLAGHTSGVLSMTIFNNKLVSGSFDRTVKIWDLSNAQCLQTLEGHAGGISILGLNENKTLLAAGYGRGNFTIWRLAEGLVVYLKNAQRLCILAYFGFTVPKLRRVLATQVR